MRRSRISVITTLGHRFNMYDLISASLLLLVLASSCTLDKAKYLDEETKERLQRTAQPLEPFSVSSLSNSLGMKFVLIRPGGFMMGSALSPDEAARRYGGHSKYYVDFYKAEHPQHNVSISKPFYLQTTEVTQGQWKAVMGSNPAKFKDCGDDFPVEQVSWSDAQEFIDELNRREAGGKYRLPTEAEWEYAARAGSTTEFCFGDDKDLLGNFAWYRGQGFNEDFGAVRTTHPVASRQPNAWGLYDMHGNVFEWCQDWFEDYQEGSVIDPTGPDMPQYFTRLLGLPDKEVPRVGSPVRVVRGGSWVSLAGECRSACRGRLAVDARAGHLGFRLARTP